LDSFLARSWALSSAQAAVLISRAGSRAAWSSSADCQTEIASQPPFSSATRRPLTVAARDCPAISGQRPCPARLRLRQPTDPPVPAIRPAWPRALPVGAGRLLKAQAPLPQVPRTCPESSRSGPSADGSPVQNAETGEPPPRSFVVCQPARLLVSWHISLTIDFIDLTELYCEALAEERKLRGPACNRVRTEAVITA